MRDPNRTFPTRKSVKKQSLSCSWDSKNSTTGCGDSSGSSETVKKGIKKDTFLPLSDTFWPALTVSMGKSSPFREYRKRRFWDPDRKQSI